MTDMNARLIDELTDAPSADLLCRTAVQRRSIEVLRPVGSLRQLDEIATWLAGWQRTDTPVVENPLLLVAVADHGVADRGDSELPTHATRALLDALRAGVATATVLAESLGVSVRVLDVGVGSPTGDISVADAMTSDEFERAFEAGRSSVRSMSTDLLLVGEIGVGNATSGAAVACGLFGGSVASWRPGVGAPDALERKKHVLEAAVARVESSDPLEVLRRLGGFEFAALAGAVVEARVRSIPVLLDGFVTVAAVAALELLVDGSLDHVMAAYRSTDPAHNRLLDELGLRPLLDLDLRLGPCRSFVPPLWPSPTWRRSTSGDSGRDFASSGSGLRSHLVPSTRSG